MRLYANVNLLGKVVKPWKDKEGNERTSYSANIMQENGQIIDTLRLTQEQYNNVTAGKNYTITADYSNGSNGAYLRIVNISENK